MADLVIVATTVVKAANNSIVTTYVFGETVTAGQAVYLKASDSKWYKALTDASTGTQEKSGYGTTLGIAMNGGAINQCAAVATGGTVTIGSTILVGVFYYVSNTAGGICAIADIGAGDYVTVIGYGTTVAILQLLPMATGLTL